MDSNYLSADDLQRKANKIKYECAELLVSKEKGHLTSCLSCAEIVTVLYYAIFRQSYDKFIMSKNHGMAVIYPILRDLGLIDDALLNSYQDNGSILGTHSKIEVNGVDFAGGSLGMGLGVSCGYALAAINDGSDSIIYCMLGDCECEEGSVWEAIMFAGAKKLSNLVVIVDQNGEGCTDFLKNLVELRPFRPKFEAFGWDVCEVNDGHSIKELLEVIGNVKKRKSDRPFCIIAKTIKGNGVPSMLDKPWLHGSVPDTVDAIDQLQQAYLKDGGHTHGF